MGDAPRLVGLLEFGEPDVNAYRCLSDVGSRAQGESNLAGRGSPTSGDSHGAASTTCVEIVRKFGFRQSPSRSAAPAPRAVNPSRKLRRFESFTCHPVFREALTSGNAGQGLSHVPLRGISGLRIPKPTAQVVDQRNAKGRVELVPNTCRSSPCRAVTTDSAAVGLRERRGRGYAIAAETHTVAICDAIAFSKASGAQGGCRLDEAVAF